MQKDKAKSRRTEEQRGIFSTAYLPPVSYFQALTKVKNVSFETCEHYEKQSYRNRCKVLTESGIMNLIIPVEKPNGNKTQIRDIRISNLGKWQHIHWGAIESAYSNSPFFEYYKDDLQPFYTKKQAFLWDFNLEMLYKIFELLDLEMPKISFTESYKKEYTDENIKDFRHTFHPKRENEISQTPYYQVFAQKFGFISDLSIIDLLFNMGNESVLKIEN